MHSAALPVLYRKDVTLGFLSHLPSSEFYGFQSVHRGKNKIKKKARKGRVLEGEDIL
jgi:hypothetical protein